MLRHVWLVVPVVLVACSVPVAVSITPTAVPPLVLAATPTPAATVPAVALSTATETAPATAARIRPMNTAEPSPTVTRPPSATMTSTATATRRVTTAPTAPPFVSGGIGLTRQEWERRHGSPTIIYDHYLQTTYEGGAYVVEFDNGRVWSITRRWPRGAAPLLRDALAEGVRLLPADATQYYSYTTRGNTLRGPGGGVYYRSPMLTTVFPPDKFMNGSPGECAVTYVVDADRVTELSIFLGRG